MAWFIIARLLFIAAVAYAAYQLQPLGGDEPIPNVGFGVLLGTLVIALEIRLKQIAESPTCWARCLAGPSGWARPRRSARRSSGPTPPTGASSSCTASSCSCLPYLGLVMGARKAEWLEPERLVSLFRDTGPQQRYRSSTPASSSTAASPTSARPASSTARWSSRSSCSRSCSSSPTPPTR